MKILPPSIMEIEYGSIIYLSLRGKKCNTVPIGELNVDGRALVQGFINNPAH